MGRDGQLIVEQPQLRYALSYCPVQRPNTLVDQELAKFIEMEGSRGDYFFPLQAGRKDSGTITMVLPCNEAVIFRVHDSLVNDLENWVILSVQIDRKPENLLIALIYDYLQEYWCTREKIFRWLRGQVDLPAKS